MFGKELDPIFYGPSRVNLQHYHMEEGEECFRMHWHERMEILRIHQGEMHVGADKDKQCVKAGEAFLIPPEIPHHGIAGKGGVTYDVIMFDIRCFYNETEACQEWLPAFFEGRIKMETVIKIPEIIECLDKIYAAEEEKGGALKRIAYVYELMYLLFAHLLISFDKDTKNVRRFQKIVQYIEENFTAEISTRSLSKQFGYSEEHFCRMFKASAGLAPMKYVRILRVEKAYELLKNGERDIGKVADACGFHDANYLTRCFKAHFGEPPSYYIMEK